jgi:hypothetical protein
MGATQKSAAQILFERIVRTWILPAARQRKQSSGSEQPIVLGAALLAWTDPARPEHPDCFFNEELNGRILGVHIVTTRPVGPGESVTAELIGGIRSPRLRADLAAKPWVLMLQGRGGKFFVRSHKMSTVIEAHDFDALREELGTKGVALTSTPVEQEVYLDVMRNRYHLLRSAGDKRKEILQLAGLLVGRVKADASIRARRWTRLPALFVYSDSEYLPILIESRQSYIHGLFFSCVAACVTTADRICNSLARRYCLPPATQRVILSQTLGQKIDKLRSERVIPEAQKSLLLKLNRIRKRHLHPRKAVSMRAVRRDALAAVELLQELVEGTFSIWRDYEPGEGGLVPRSLVTRAR